MSVGSATNPFNPHLGVLNSSQKEGEGEREASTAVSVSSEGQPEGQAQVEGLGGINLNLLAIQSGIDLGPMGHHREGSGDSQRSESSASFTRKDSDSDAPLTGRKDSDASTTSTSSTSSKSSHVSSADLPMTNEVKGHEKAQELLKPFAAELKGKEHWSLECFVLKFTFENFLKRAGYFTNDNQQFLKNFSQIFHVIYKYINYFEGKESLLQVVEFTTGPLKTLKNKDQLLALAKQNELHQQTINELQQDTVKSTDSSQTNYGVFKGAIPFVEQFLQVTFDIANRSHSSATKKEIEADDFYGKLNSTIADFQFKTNTVLSKLKQYTSTEAQYPAGSIRDLLLRNKDDIEKYDDVTPKGKEPIQGSPNEKIMIEIVRRLVLPIDSSAIFGLLRKYDAKYHLDIKTRDYLMIPTPISKRHMLTESGLI